MQLKPLTLALFAATGLSACGGGGSSSGSTLAESRSLNTQALLACVDTNRNWQCDDGDITASVSATGNTGLAPDSDQFTLIERRDSQNARTQLLLSTAGSSTVTGHSTLRTLLTAAGENSDAIDAAVAALGNTALEQGYSAALTDAPVALAALDLYSRAAAAQGTTAPSYSEFAPAAGSTETLAHWESDETEGTTRQLSANGSRVLNNSETNRLFFFDAAATTPASAEFDLIPLDITSLAHTSPLLRQGVALLHDVLDLVVDTVSAATAFTGTPSTGSAVELDPGQGISAARLVNGGREALISLNMLNGSYSGDTCQSATGGNEGLFRVSLEDDASYRLLADNPACVHSGFTLIASDAVGSQVAAWDSDAGKLWLLDGATLAARRVIPLHLDAGTPVQALAMTPGGRYLAVVRYGGVVLVDVAEGQVLQHLTGDWGNVSGAGFAAGARKLLIANGQNVHTLTFSDSLQLLERHSTGVSNGSDTLTSLSISADGESYIATSDRTAYWNSVNGTALDSITLASGLDVQQTVLADNRIVIIARGSQDQQFKLLRIALNMPSIDLGNGL